MARSSCSSTWCRYSLVARDERHRVRDERRRDVGTPSYGREKHGFVAGVIVGYADDEHLRVRRLLRDEREGRRERGLHLLVDHVDQEVVSRRRVVDRLAAVRREEVGCDTEHRAGRGLRDAGLRDPGEAEIVAADRDRDDVGGRAQRVGLDRCGSAAGVGYLRGCRDVLGDRAAAAAVVQHEVRAPPQQGAGSSPETGSILVPARRRDRGARTPAEYESPSATYSRPSVVDAAAAPSAGPPTAPIAPIAPSIANATATRQRGRDQRAGSATSTCSRASGARAALAASTIPKMTTTRSRSSWRPARACCRSSAGT